MQAVTHLAAGAALVWVHRAPPRGAWRLGLACALAAGTHAVLDDLARATYHPPEPAFTDPFWVAFHVVALAAAAWVAWRFRRHGPVMAAALLPDLDWLVGRPFGLWADGAVHAWFRGLPGLATCSEALRATVPDLRQHPAGALTEILLVCGMSALVRLAGRERGTGQPASRRAS